MILKNFNLIMNMSITIIVKNYHYNLNKYNNKEIKLILITKL